MGTGVRSLSCGARHGMPVNRSDVIWAYRAFLGREPENDDVVDLHCGASDFRSLCESFIGSNEFKILSGASAKAGGLAPPPGPMPPPPIYTTGGTPHNAP